ncbi:hypothetical protein [Cellulomonas hominis]
MGADPLLAEQVRARRVLAGLADERRAADRVMVAALTPVGAYDGRGLADLAGAGGLSDPSGVTRVSLAWALGELAASPGELTSGQWAELGRYLGAHQHDAGVMGVFFTVLGGQGTVDLVTAISERAYVLPGEQAGLAAMLAALAGGLGRASGSWSGVGADRFTASIDLSEVDIASLGLLLGAAHPPLAATLALSLANLLDENERVRGVYLGRVFVHDPSAMLGPAAAAMAYQLGLDPAGLGDLAVPVLGLLGAYPDQALAWLAGAGDRVLSGARIAYWFGGRDWLTTGDGFATPTGLWDAAQHASGGHLDTATFDLQVWHDIANTTAAIIQALAQRPDFLPENLTPAAAENLAGAIGDMLRYYLETPYLRDPAQRSWGEGILRELPGLGPDGLPVPGLDRVWLNELIGVAVTGGDGGGAARFAAELGEVFAALQAGVFDGTRLSPEEALLRIALLQGVVTGAGVGTELAAAAREDARVQEWIDGIGTVLGWIPVAGGVAGSIAESLVIEGGSRLAGTEFAQTYQSLLDEYREGGHEDEVRAQLLANVLAMHDQLVQTGTLTDDPDSLRDYIDLLYSEYSRNRSAGKDESEDANK